MIELKNVSFRYASGGGESQQGISNINLTINTGECVALIGESGCGKTTVTRVVNGLAPTFYAGNRSGAIRIDGKALADLPAWEIGEMVGSVFQDPKSQFFSSELTGEVAFGCENFGFPQAEIRERTEEAIDALNLNRLRSRPLDLLSSGEKQRTAIASVYALRPKVFACDEPTANLDEDGVERLRETLTTLKSSGHALLVAEHRLSWLDGIADYYIYLSKGEIQKEFSADDLKRLNERERAELGLRSPTRLPLPRLPLPTRTETTILSAENLCRRYGETTLWEKLNFAANRGSVTAIAGKNGIGKSTLALILAGLEKKTGGTIQLNGAAADPNRLRSAVYYCSNDTGTQFFTDSVAEELLLTIQRTEENLETARTLLKRMGLYAFRAAHPATLSGGQKQRLAIACGLISGREILIFDEPTSGLDGANMRRIAVELKAAAASGRAVMVITHDHELIETCCDAMIRL